MEDDQYGGLPPVFVHRNPYYKKSKILLIAIVSLVAVVFSILLLHIYAKYVLRRQARRRDALRRLSLSVAAQLIVAEPPKTGLDPLVIATLPTFTFKAEDEAVRPECSVCLSMLLDEEMVRLLPNCNHVFHLECIDKWLDMHGTCPVCRTKVEPRLRAEPREGPARCAISVAVEPFCNNMVGTSEDREGREHGKCCESGSRFGSFRRMLNRDRSASFRRVQSFEQGDDDFEDPQIQR